MYAYVFVGVKDVSLPIGSREPFYQHVYSDYDMDNEVHSFFIWGVIHKSMP